MKTVEKIANKTLNHVHQKRPYRTNKIISIFTYSLLVLSSDNAQATNQCELIRSGLENEIVNLCLSYQDIGNIEEYEKKSKSINDKRNKYIRCAENHNTLDMHASSLYVLSEIKFFIKLRKKWAENPVAWLAVEGIVSKKVEEKCNQFNSKIQEQ